MTDRDYALWAEASLTGNGQLAATLPVLPHRCPACGRSTCPYWCALNDDPYARSSGRPENSRNRTRHQIRR